MQPSVEILIPAFNAERTLAATLRSVQQQTIPLQHVTVIDDQSSDRTAEIARSFPSVGYECNPANLGGAGNWNRCLEKARAQYVCLLHADDLLLPEWHERCLLAIRDHSPQDKAAIYFGAARFSKSKTVEIFSFAKQTSFYEKGELLRLLWRHCFYGLTTSACMVYPQAMIDRLGYFPADIFPAMADVPYHWRLLLQEPIVYEPRVSVMIRSGEAGQITSTRQTELLEGAIASFQPHLQDIAVALDQSISKTAAAYFFPYHVRMLLKRMGVSRFQVPTGASSVIQQAMRRIGPLTLFSMAIRQILETRRRRFLLWKYAWLNSWLESHV